MRLCHCAPVVDARSVLEYGLLCRREQRKFGISRPSTWPMNRSELLEQHVALSFEPLKYLEGKASLFMVDIDPAIVSTPGAFWLAEDATRKGREIDQSDMCRDPDLLARWARASRSGNCRTEVWIPTRVAPEFFTGLHAASSAMPDLLAATSGLDLAMELFELRRPGPAGLATRLACVVEVPETERHVFYRAREPDSQHTRAPVRDRDDHPVTVLAMANAPTEEHLVNIDGRLR